MANHSSVLAWKIPWTEEVGGPQSMELQTWLNNWADTQISYIITPSPRVYSYGAHRPLDKIRTPKSTKRLDSFLGFPKYMLLNEVYMPTNHIWPTDLGTSISRISHPWHHGHFGPDCSWLCRAVPSAVGGLAAYFDSTHEILVTLLHQPWQPAVSPDIA